MRWRGRGISEVCLTVKHDCRCDAIRCRPGVAAVRARDRPAADRGGGCGGRSVRGRRRPHRRNAARVARPPRGAARPGCRGHRRAQPGHGRRLPDAGPRARGAPARARRAAVSLRVGVHGQRGVDPPAGLEPDQPARAQPNPIGGSASPRRCSPRGSSRARSPRRSSSVAYPLGGASPTTARRRRSGSASARPLHSPRPSRCSRCRTRRRRARGRDLRDRLRRLRPRLDLRVLAFLFGFTVVLGTLARDWDLPSQVLGASGRLPTAAIAAASSIVVNNLPAAVLLSAHAPSHPRALLLGLDLGPNLAVTGSLSAVLWLQAARTVKADASIVTYSRLGCCSCRSRSGCARRLVGVWLTSGRRGCACSRRPLTRPRDSRSIHSNGGCRPSAARQGVDNLSTARRCSLWPASVSCSSAPPSCPRSSSRRAPAGSGAAEAPSRPAPLDRHR